MAEGFTVWRHGKVYRTVPQNDTGWRQKAIGLSAGLRPVPFGSLPCKRAQQGSRLTEQIVTDGDWAFENGVPHPAATAIIATPRLFLTLT
jgi:hypothetical protein